MATGTSHRVVIVGSGFGGLFAAKFLRRAPVEVTLIDRTNHHLFQPLLYQVATGILSPGDIAPATRDVLRRHRNVSVVLGEVTGFDLDAREVVAIGPDGPSAPAPVRQSRCRGRRRAVVLRPRRVRAVGPRHEDARRCPRCSTRASSAPSRWRNSRRIPSGDAWLTFVGRRGRADRRGDLGADRRARATRALRDNFRIDSIRPTRRVVLFDGGKEILASFGDRLSARRRRSSSGPASRSSAVVVTHVDGEGVVVRRRGRGRGARSAAKTVIWAAGVSASPLARHAGRRMPARNATAAGRIKVLPDCSLAGPSRGVRRRRHDGARRAPRRGRGRDADRESTSHGRSRSEWRRGRPSRSSTAISAAWRPCPGAARS